MRIPDYNIVNFMNAADPQTDRELMIKIGEEVKRLSHSIDRFAEKLEEFEEKKMSIIDERVDKLIAWKNQWEGSWKLVIILSGAVSLVAAILAIYARS